MSTPCGWTRAQGGFSLVEVAIAMVIVGLLVGGLLMPLSAQVEQGQRDETAAALDAIREALIGYAIANRRLPCPDANGNGLADDACPAGANRVNIGAPPLASLGLERLDAWGNAYRYAVNGAYTGPIAFNTAGSGNGVIEVWQTANCAGAAGDRVAVNVAALVVSGGKTRYPSALEAENRDNDRCFVSAGYSTLSPLQIDDLVRWLSPDRLKARLAAAGRPL